MSRKIIESVQGFRTTDGAGVNLVRVLGRETTEGYDPLLMLDSFDSKDPNDYIKGFPFHPHRGIETITFLEQGEIAHKDSMGNEDVIRPGDCQWMTAGSGIEHEEMPLPADRMLGVQVWLNLAAKDKMTQPFYHTLTHDSMPQVPVDGGNVKIISGEFNGTQGFQAPNHDLHFLSIKLDAGKELTFPTREEDQVIFFTLEGDALVEGQEVKEKTAVVLEKGSEVTVKAGETPMQILFFSGEALREPVAWSGPIVMNTREELHQAWLDLRNGDFIKDQAAGI